MSTFDAYRRWLDVRPDEVRTHYRLLGLPLFETDWAAIEAAAGRRMAAVRAFESGEHAETARKILGELAVARACLLDPRRKAEYDQRIRSELRIGGGAGSLRPTPGLVLAGLGLLVVASFFLAAWLARTMQPSPVGGLSSGRQSSPVLGETVLDDEPFEFPPKVREAAVAEDPGPPHRLPIPSEEVQQAYRDLIMEVYGAVGANALAEKPNLARQLFSLAQRARKDPNERYVLLDTAMKLAEETGDTGVARQARDMLTAEYDVEMTAPRAEATAGPLAVPTAELPE